MLKVALGAKSGLPDLGRETHVVLSGPSKAVCALLLSRRLKAIRHLVLSAVKTKDAPAVLGALEKARLPLSELTWVAADRTDEAAGIVAQSPALATLRAFGFVAALPACTSPFHQGLRSTDLVSGRGLAALCLSPQLRRIAALTLGNLFDAPSAEWLVGAKWPRLKKLTVFDTDEAAGSVLCASELVGRLESLELAQLSAAGARALAANPRATRLRVLGAEGGVQIRDRISDREIVALGEQLHDLRVLDARHWALGAKGVGGLGPSSFSRLEALDLYDVDLTLPTAKALARTKAFGSLDTLFVSLDEWVLQDDLGPAVAALFDSALFQRLRRVALLGVANDRGDLALQALVDRGMPELRELYVGGSNLMSFGSEGARALVASKKTPKLRSLFFTGSARGKSLPKALAAELGERYCVRQSPMPFHEAIDVRLDLA